jgi:quercetin dioxygenase-like cupin family protein
MEVTALEELTDTPHAEVFENRDPRTVRLQLAEGESVPPHTHPGTDVVLHLLSGRLELSFDGETHEVVAGELVQFSGDREVSPRAVEPATAVLVFAPR